VLEDRLAPASHTWIGGDTSHTDGDARGHPSDPNAAVEWNNPLNWLDNTVPAAGDTAVFTPNTGSFTFSDMDPDGTVDLPITYTGPFNLSPLINVPVSVASLQVSSSATTFALSVAAGQSFTLTGASEWDAGSIGTASSASLTIANTATLTLNGASAVSVFGTGTVNQGTINQTGAGGLFIADGSTLTNQNGGLYDLQSDAGLTTHLNGTFVNAAGGTYRKSGGTGTSSNDTFFTNNGGTLTVSSGNLKVQFATYSGTSTFTAVNSGNVLEIAGSSTSTATGTLTGSGAGQVVLTSSGHLNAGSGGATFSFPAGYFQWQGGTIDGGAAGLTVAAGKFLTLSGGATKVLFHQMSNAGTIVQTDAGSLAIGDGSTLTNQSGGLYDLQSDAGVTTHLSGTFVNAAGGTFRKSGGATSSVIDSFFSNPGTVEARAATLAIEFVTTQISGNTITGGTWKVFDPATLTLNFGVSLTTNNGTIVLDGPNPVFSNITNLSTNGGSFSVLDGGSFTTAGNFTNNGTLAVDGTSTFIVSGNLTNFSGTTLTGGSYQISGTFQFTGANIVTDAATLVLDGATAQITDQTSANALANLATIAAAGRLTVQNGQSFTTAGNFSDLGVLTVGANGTFSVSGTLSVGSGATLTDLSTGP
jgi:hypothetical protein